MATPPALLRNSLTLYKGMRNRPTCLGSSGGFYLHSASHLTLEAKRSVPNFARFPAPDRSRRSTRYARTLIESHRAVVSSPGDAQPCDQVERLVPEPRLELGRVSLPGGF